MIRRVVNLEDARLVCDSFKDFVDTNKINHFGDYKFDPETLFLAWGNVNLLVNSCVLVASFTDGGVDAVSWFVIGRDFRINETFAQSYIWISKNHKHGVQVFLGALKVLYRKNIKLINVGILHNSPYKDRIKKFLLKNGFKPEDESFYIKL